MKILNTLICFLCLAFVSNQAAIIEVAPADARMGNMIFGGRTSSADSPTYVFSEDMDSDQLCATSHTSNCTNTWTATGTLDFQATGINGTYGVEIEGGEDIESPDFSSSIGTDGSGGWIFFRVKPSIWAISAERLLARLETTSGGYVAGLYAQTNERLKIKHYLTSASGTTILNATDTFSIWVYYEQDDGAASDGIMRLYVAVNSTTFPGIGNHEAEVTTGTSNDLIGQVQLHGGTGEVVAVFDYIRVDDVSIGSTPE